MVDNKEITSLALARTYGSVTEAEITTAKNSESGRRHKAIASKLFVKPTDDTKAKTLGELALVLGEKFTTQGKAITLALNNMAASHTDETPLSDEDILGAYKNLDTIMETIQNLNEVYTLNYMIVKDVVFAAGTDEAAAAAKSAANSKRAEKERLDMEFKLNLMAMMKELQGKVAAMPSAPATTNP